MGLAAAAAIAAAIGIGAGRARAADPFDADKLHALFELDTGLVLPYPLDNLFRGWVECTGRGHHKALDIGGVGKDFGLGSGVRAMAKAKVLAIGMPADDPARFGTPLTNVATVERGGQTLPASKDVPGYGRVWFFTKDYGRHRSGGVISLELLDGPLKGYHAHYLHVAAAKPGLAVGAIVGKGEEIGLLGGTAVLDAGPHLHLTLETREGRPVDVGNVFGIGATRVPCKAGKELTAAIRARYSKAAKVLMAALREGRRAVVEAPEPIAACGPQVIEGDFADGGVREHRFVVSEDEAMTPFTVSVERLEGKHWAPRVQIEDAGGEPLFTGTLARPKAKRRAAFISRSSGKRGVAVVTVTPKKPEALVVRLMAWPPAGKRQLKGATWRITIDRPCVVKADDDAP